MKSFHIKSEAVKLLRDFFIMVGNCIVAFFWFIILIIMLILAMPILLIIAIILILDEMINGDRYV